jgi:hypothetical protein
MIPRVNSVAVLLFLLAGIPGKGWGGERVEAGFLAHEFDLTLESGTRLEVLGPLFSREERPEEFVWALSPLMSFTTNSGVDSQKFDLLYPLFTYDRNGKERLWQFFQVLNFVGAENQAGTYPRRFSLFPFYLQQRSVDTHLNYTSVFPVYGSIKNRLRRDEIRFVMFPIYLESRKQDVVTQNYLFPVFHRRLGDQMAGWQFWPIYGQEHKGTTYRTNGWNEVEVVGGYHNYFAAWPLVLGQHTGLGTTNEAWFLAVLPFFSAQRSPTRDSTTYLWPLFTVTEDREKRYREWDVPWPFLMFARGAGKTANRVWPLFSRAYNTNLQSGFFLWPVYKYNAFRTESAQRERHRIFFFLYSHKREKLTETGQTRHRSDLWPLFTAQKDFDGNRRVQVLALLEPIWPDNSSIQRNYSPLWWFWRFEKNAQTGRESRSLLWNLLRWEKGPDMKKGAFLFGLLKYETTVEGTRWRWFYLPTRKHGREIKPTPVPGS